MGDRCFVKVQGENQVMFPGEKGGESLFFCEFFSKKAEESVTVFFKVDGKIVHDNPRKRTVKCTTDVEKKKFFGSAETIVPKFVHYEWLWSVNSSFCRLIVEEPHQHPIESSTAVINFAFDGADRIMSTASVLSLSTDSAGRGRGAGQDQPPGTPPEESGRGRGKKDRPKSAGRGRGERRRSMSGEDVTPLSRPRSSSAGGDSGNVIQQQLPRENSVVEASLDTYAKMSALEGSHVIVCCGGPSRSHVEALSELLACRVLERAREKGIHSLSMAEILQEPYATHEFYMFCNLRLLLSKAGVGRCVLVARDVDCERLLMLWTEVMAGLKIGISTKPVPTPEAMREDKKREAARKLSDVVEEIKHRLKS